MAELSATVVDSMWHGASGRALAEGWRRHVGPADEVDFGDYFLPGSSLGLRTLGRLARPLSIKALNDAVVASVERASSEVMLSLKGNGLAAGTLDRLGTAGAKSVIYYPDYHLDHPLLDLEVIERADLVCTTKSFQMDYLRSLRGPGRTVLVHHGYSPAAHRPRLESVEESDFLYDISYVGNYDPYKARWLLPIASAFADKKILVAGAGWERPARSTPLEKFVHPGQIVGDRLAILHQRSRINLGIHCGAHARTGWRDLVSTRTFEIPACKGFMLHEDNWEVRTLFDAGREIDTFRDHEELCGRISHYLASPEERRDMIERAYRRAVPAYSYYERAREIADAVRNLTAAPRPAHASAGSRHLRPDSGSGAEFDRAAPA